MRKSFLLCVWAFLSVHLNAQPIDTLDVTLLKEKESLLGKAYYVTTPITGSIKEVQEKIMNGKLNRFTRNNVGFTNQIFWLIIPLKNIEQAKTPYRLEIQNPQIDKLQAYCITKNSITTLGSPTGDYYPFNTRYLNNSNFIWPLSACQLNALALVIRIEKLNSSLLIPAYLWTEEAHRGNVVSSSIFYGVIFGFMILILIYTLIAGLVLRSSTYFFYAFYVSSAILFLATQEGFSFQFIYPDRGNFNSTFRVIVSTLTCVAFTFFSRRFLSIKKYKPRIDFILQLILYTFLILFLFNLFLKEYFLKNSSLVLPIVLSLIAIANLLFLFTAIKTYRQQKNESSFYIVAFSMLIGSGLTVITEDFGWIEKLPFNPLLPGFLFEIFIFSLGITYQIKKMQDERNDLIMKLSRYQKEMLQSYVQGIEKERERFAGELHDDIGSRLSALRLMVSQSKTYNNQFVEEQLTSLTEDIRSLSHQLAPPSLKYKGLTQLVSDLVSSVSVSSGIETSFQCFDVPQNLPENHNHQIYRIIQEALNNTIKHAKATQADVQIFGHEDELVITIEDNGKGFNVSNTMAGLGLNQMRTRIEAINGRLEINSSASGTQILITAPYPHD